MQFRWWLYQKSQHTGYFFGKKRFATLRNVYNNLAGGNNIKLRKPYPYRAKPQNIATEIQYLQGQLPVIPGKTRHIQKWAQVWEKTSTLDWGEIPNETVQWVQIPPLKSCWKIRSTKIYCPWKDSMYEAINEDWIVIVLCEGEGRW